MRLSDIATIGCLSVLRDGEFQNLGFVSQGREDVLVFLEDGRFAAALRRGKGVSAVLTRPQLIGQVPQSLALAVCADPRGSFAAIHNELARNGFYWQEFETEVDPCADIHPTAWVAASNVRIGRGSIVGPHATILERCVIGQDVRVGAGAVLGGAGFQTVRSSRPMLEMRHAGGLAVGDRAHILPAAVVATGLFRENTELSSDVRIGSHSFVSHAVRIGGRSFVGHGAVVNGNVVIGDDAWIGPGAVIAHNLQIGDGACVSLGAVVIRDVPGGVRVSGNFAVSHRRLLRSLAAMESDPPG